jgi:hypothetical protein
MDRHGLVPWPRQARPPGQRGAQTRAARGCGSKGAAEAPLTLATPRSPPGRQVSAALNPDNAGGGGGTKAFQECVLIRHPRQGEYAIAFITGRTTLQVQGRGGA